MDEFPSAFERFEEEVPVSRFRDYARLKKAFVSWAGYKWIDSMEQNRALRKEALNRGIRFRGEPTTARREFFASVQAARRERRARIVFATDRLGREHKRANHPFTTPQGKHYRKGQFVPLSKHERTARRPRPRETKRRG